jgi:hypothetical protein
MALLSRGELIEQLPTVIVNRRQRAIQGGAGELIAPEGLELLQILSGIRPSRAHGNIPSTSQPHQDWRTQGARTGAKVPASTGHLACGLRLGPGEQSLSDLRNDAGAAAT